MTPERDTVAAQSARWVALAVTAGVVWLLLWWAMSKPAVCAIDSPTMRACSQEARSAPALIGWIVTIALALLTAAGMVFTPPRFRLTVCLIGVVALAASGVVFVVLTLFSAGFSIP